MLSYNTTKIYKDDFGVNIRFFVKYVLHIKKHSVYL